MPTQFTFPIVKDILVCAGKPALDRGFTVEWPDLDKPGLPNIIKSTIQGIISVQLQFITFIKGWIDKAKEVLTNAAKLQKVVTDFLKDLASWPSKVIKEIVKNFTAELKLPDIKKMIVDWLSPYNVHFDSLNIPDIAAILTNVLTKIVTGGKSVKQALESEISGFLTPIMNTVMSARNAVVNVATTITNQISQIVEGIQKFIKKYMDLLMFFISLPGTILKVIFNFLIKGLTSLVELATKGFTALMTTVKETLSSIAISTLNALGLNVDIPHSPTPPILTLVLCLLNALVDIFKNFPGNVVNLRQLPALLPTVT
jgi:phage-related protein